jgi:DNA-binding beta-propeller fold protein YncE
MGGRDRDSAGAEADSIGFSAVRDARLPRAWRAPLLALWLVLGGLMLGSPSLAAAEVHHGFGSSFKGTGKCEFTEPGGLAVDDSTGNVYLFDRATNAVNVFTPTGECITHRKITKAETGEEGNEGLAFDNASPSTSPSAGDVYVVDAESHSIHKYRLVEENGKQILKQVRVIKKFKRSENGEVVEEFEEFSEVHGLAVDANGGLWVSEEEAVDSFSNGEPNKFLARPEVSSPSGCSPLPGFAVGSNPSTGEAEFFYVAHERENRKGECEEPAVLMKTNLAGEPVPSEPTPFEAQLDNQNTTGAAVDRTTGDVYFDNKTNVSAFSSKSLFIERFGDEPGAGQLQEGTGIAVNSATKSVYVADAHGGQGEVKVYVPKTTQEPPEHEPKVQLPDGRKWELVTPQIKFGAAILPITLERGLTQASEDGSALGYVATAPIVPTPPSNRAPESAPILSKRTAGGWSTEGIGSPRSQVPAGYQVDSGTEYRFFSNDLSVALLEPDLGIKTPDEPPLSPDATETTLYWRDMTRPSTACEPTPSTCYQPVVSPANATAHNPFGAKLQFLSATPDARHTVLKSDVALTPEATEAEGLYETEPGGSLRLISVLPELEAGTAAEAKLGQRGAQSGNMRHAISNDASRIVWSGEESKLYLRYMNAGKTIRVDKSQGVEEPAEPAADFQTASADGSKVFFTDPQKLTPDSSVEEEELEGGDLYVCEVPTEGAGCNLTDLTGKNAVENANENAGVQSVIGSSNDGSYVYFVANGVLAPKAGRGACTFRTPVQQQEEREGKIPVLSCNLYVVHFNGQAWEKPKFIASLTTEDAKDWELVAERGDLGATTSRVSPNGVHLAFMSNRSLTGYNNVDAKSKALDEEVFLYNFETNRVVCASCNPEGHQPVGVFDQEQSGEGLGLVIDRQKNWEGSWLAANIPGWTGLSVERALYQSRYLSDTGRLFFNSVDSLVPADTNGKADVYELEPNGEGSCTSPTGCVSLITSGTSQQESSFMDASATGNDVFVFTSARLVEEEDKDTAFDIYDAHVCSSSSPCLTPPPPPPPPCKGEECKAPMSSQAALPGAPPSAAPGAGNAGTHEVLGEKKVVKKPETRAQKLKKALKACKKLKKKKNRVTCEKQARKKYGPAKKAGKSTKGHHKGKK